jgi:hypothetical protein
VLLVATPRSLIDRLPLVWTAAPAQRGWSTATRTTSRARNLPESREHADVEDGRNDQRQRYVERPQHRRATAHLGGPAADGP